MEDKIVGGGGVRAAAVEAGVRVSGRNPIGPSVL